ncbi:MAG: hypothetical protein JSS65_12575 [Armatimonadetes bacterium]|nr:hypothetical protein [Armatimonadota bacterium]
MQFGDGQTAKRWVVVALAVFAGLMGFAFLRNVVASFLGVGAVLLSTSELFLPVRYRLDDNGAQSKCGWSSTEVKWGDVRRVVDGELGVKLSPVPENSKVAPFRGVYLRFNGNREEVLATIRALQERHAELLGN